MGISIFGKSRGRAFMPDYLIRQDVAFQNGFTSITKITDTTYSTGINFGVLKLTKGEKKDLSSDLESAYLLMDGKVNFFFDKQNIVKERHSLFDESPIALHFSRNAEVSIEALSDCEFLISQTDNAKSFKTVLFTEDNMLENEHRGKGLLDDTAYRIVRTIFDIRNRPEANLVLGEVITFPGRWSSYPPHHHPQPEIYHYRFTESLGYGHGECGDQVFKIRENDTLRILDELDHGQAAAPGYGMYYAWIIRHLDGLPYTIPEFTQEHAWTKEKGANERVWR